MAKEINHPNHITTVYFNLKGVTPGALRYEEVDENGIVKKGDSEGAFVATLYLRKKALNGLEPKSLKVDIDNRTT